MKLKSPSCEKVGRAVGGMLPADSGIESACREDGVVGDESATGEQRRGCLGSGALPSHCRCANKPRGETRPRTFFAQGGLTVVISQILPPARTPIPEHTNPLSREPTGGQTRCEEAGEPMSRRWAERGNALRWWRQMNLRREIHRTLSVPRPRQASTECHAQTTAAQKERASLASSCSNPDHDDPATSKA